MEKDDEGPNPVAILLKKINKRVGELEAAIEESDIRVGAISDRNDELSRAIRELGRTHISALDTFNDMLTKQRQEHREMLEAQEQRWRAGQERLEAQYRQSNERIVEETMSRISGMFVKSTAETLTKWLWPGLLAGAIAVMGWLFNQITFSK